MDRFIGLDAHVSSCTLAVVGPTGRKIRVDVVDTQASALVAYLQGIAGTKHLCLEECALSEWLYEVLAPHVAETVVMGQNQAKRGRKSDAHDAVTLAQRLRVGDTGRHVYKDGARYQRLRALTRTYDKLQRDLTRLKNRIRWLYYSRGVRPEATSVYHPTRRELWLRKCPAKMRPAVQLHYAALDALSPVVEHCEEQLTREVERHATAKVLLTCPGLGVVRTAQVMSVIINPHRFRTKRQLWSYCGLGIVTRSSSDWVRDQDRWIKAQVAQCRGLNRVHNRTLKNVFKGAAMVVSGRLKAEHPLRQYYEQLLTKGTKPNLAQLTLARKLAAMVLAMWKRHEEFNPAMI